MSISPALWQMFQQQPGRTDAELAANMMRMVALWPLVREDIGLGRAREAMEIMRAQGLEPGSEAFAQQYGERIAPIVERYPGIEKRGVTRAIPFRRVISGQEFGQQFPNAMQPIVAQVQAAVEPILASAPASVREQSMKAIMAMVNSGQIPVWQQPDGTIRVDTEAAQRTLTAIMPNVIRLASELPQTTPLQVYLEEKMPGLLTLARDNPVLKAHLAMPVDWREPQRAMGAFLQEMRGNAESILQGAMATVEAFKIDRSPASFERAANALAGVDAMVGQGILAGTVAQGLRAQLAAWQSRGQKVVLPDGREVHMDLAQAQEYTNTRMVYLSKQAEQVGLALGQRPGDPTLMKRKELLLAQGVKEGLDVLPILQAVYGREQLDFQKARMEMAGAAQRLANMRQEYVAQGMQMEQMGITLGREKEKARLWNQALQSGTVSTWSPAQRAFMGLPDQIDLDTWGKWQGQHGPRYSAVAQAVPAAQNRDAARSAFNGLLELYRIDRSVNDMGRAGQVTSGPSRISTIRNLTLGRDILPEIVRYTQRGWISQAEASAFLSETHSEFTLAVQGGVFGDPRSERVQKAVLPYTQAIAAAEKAINTTVVTPSWWDWLRNKFKFGLTPVSFVGPVPR